MRVLVFEDTYDVEAMLESAGVDLRSHIVLQRWNSNEPVEQIEKFAPDVVLLDFFMPPHTGLQVLKLLNKAVKEETIHRPQHVIGISSEADANELMKLEGADEVVIKFQLHSLGIWNEL